VADETGAQILRTGDRGLVRFRFMQRAEYLKVGTKLIFREGRTKGLGTVREVFPVKDTAGAFAQLESKVTHSRSSTKDGGMKDAAASAKSLKGHLRQGTGEASKALR